MRAQLIGTVWLAAVLCAPAAETARVIGNRVNLRARPDLRAEVLGQAERNDVFTVKSIGPEWVEIEPPDAVEAWVHGEFVEAGEVIAPQLNVRSGPGINHTVINQLERGDRVTTRDSFAEWISIAPPDGSSVWIARDFVEILRPDPPPPPPPPPPVIEPPPPPPPPPPVPEPEPLRPVPPAPVVERPVPPPPVDLKLIPLEGQGALVERAGVLRPAGFFFGRPSRYRLTRERGHTIETICYVKGNEPQLQSLLGQHLVVTGREYWVQGARHSVLLPDQIILQSPAR
jgi:SH3-like domain-containing protein